MPRSEGNPKGRTVTLHMVASLDGFIAKKDNSVSWLNSTGAVYDAGVSLPRRKLRPSSLLGQGLRLFDGCLTEERWNLKNVVAYKNCFVELSYAAPRDMKS